LAIMWKMGSVIGWILSDYRHEFRRSGAGAPDRTRDRRRIILSQTAAPAAAPARGA
jgi:hypothetical protein